VAYHDRGFEILGIAFVKGGKKGKRQLSRYLDGKQATWPQVLSESASWYAAPFEEYDVRYLPLHLLLDSRGRIVDINPRGEQLDEAVERALEAEVPPW
jgi:hypothetical protein